MKRWCSALVAGILAVSSAVFADTCGEASNSTVNLARNFRLTVTDATRATRQGIKVSLGSVDRYDTMHPVATGTTDSNGVLNFVKVVAGDYTLQMIDATTERQRRKVHVAVTGDAAYEFSWPFVNWMQLRAASGLLHYYAEPMRHWNIALLQFPDAVEISNTDTDNQGRFDLPALSAGRYWLEVAENNTQTGIKRPVGRIPINVTLDEKLPALDSIFITTSSCGLNYDQFCTLPPEKLTGSCLQIVNSKGTAIAATANLISLVGSSTTKFSTDKDGYFKLPAFVGDYDLTIYAKDYTPVRQRIHLSPTDSTCNTAIVIPMYPFGSSCKAPLPGKGN
ncbi:hypothetical protein Acid345_2196 [Candidatus Koribacter versatilis Ellin345]|uniref:Carboxypeptidase regulatory-like domain-containing protein n=1 Tax=Koribacter versatilis (strain Ellin345) TaxID=204669 RepID=Q1IPK3_KORVE|nr:carboxypeptidase regulatory-like domain-containing protein [Candidatus Koribacter versatilis]ABF41197.1 hypothetical protein Acid345_2196 [Candidatus Koribacter versatilis Ellin345]